MRYFIHDSAYVSDQAVIGNDAKIWNYVQIRERAEVGEGCIVGKNVYIDFDVKIGKNCKIQNNSSVFHGAILEDGVYIGPHVIITNDKNPRAINPDGTLKMADDWVVGKTLIKYGASLGAGVIVLPGVTIGRFAMIGSGAVITRDVPDFGLVVGSPGRVIGTVDETGKVVNGQE